MEAPHACDEEDRRTVDDRQTTKDDFFAPQVFGGISPALLIVT